MTRSIASSASSWELCFRRSTGLHLSRNNWRREDYPFADRLLLSLPRTLTAVGLQFVVSRLFLARLYRVRSRVGPLRLQASQGPAGENVEVATGKDSMALDEVRALHNGTFRNVLLKRKTP